jgi:hypothetical protein
MLKDLCVPTYLHSSPIGVISRSELLRLARHGHISHRFSLRLFIFNPFRGYLATRVTAFGASFAKPTGFTKAIISRSELLRFIFNPFRGCAFFTEPTGFTCGYSYSTPFGVDASFVKPTGFTCGYSYSTPFGVISLRELLRLARLSQNPQVAPGAIHIQPLSGLGPLSGPFSCCTWGYYLAPHSPGFTWGYSYSTPLGLGFSHGIPQVSPGAIHIQPLWGWALFRPFPQVSPGAIHIQPLWGCPRLHLGLLSRSAFPRFHLGLFIFNPFGVGLLARHSPGFTWGYSYSTPLGLP